MITGNTSQLHLYKNINTEINTAIEILLSLDLPNLAPGTYQLPGSTGYYMVNEYSTKSIAECPPERHNQFTDIQIMLDGSEKFGYVPFSDQVPAIEFRDDNDVAFYDIPAAEIDYITLTPGKFILFLPTDIHQPEVCVDNPIAVKKLVFKIAAASEKNSN